MELYRELLETADLEQVDELFGQFLAIAKEQFYSICTVLFEEGYGIIKYDFHNVPDPMIASWRYRNPGPSHPEQFFTTKDS
jgi:peptide/nickel transport system substrate-binding protein